MHVCIAPFYLTCLNCGFPPVISFAISNSFQQLQKSRPVYNNKNKNEKKKKKKPSPGLSSISLLLWKLRAMRGILAANNHGNTK